MGHTVSESTSFHYELRSAEQLQAIASAPLPGSITAGAAVRTFHRDLYLDSDDATLRRRGVACRLRIGASDANLLTLRITGTHEDPPVRIDAHVQSATVPEALAESNSVTRRLRALIDPSALQVRVDLEVERLTRSASFDFFRRPRIQMHLDKLTVRSGRGARTFYHVCGHLRRGSADVFTQLARALADEHGLGHPDDVRAHGELLLKWIRADGSGKSLGESDQSHPVSRTSASSALELLNPELSLVAFQRRVLALAEDPATPLRARLRFLGIVSCNLDELYMVRMAALRRDAASRRAVGEDGLTGEERLALVEREIRELLAAQSRCASECLSAAAALGTHVLPWSTLRTDERDALRARCRDEIHPGLTPLAMTLSPGHPLPHLPHLGLLLAVVFRREPGGAPHLAELELPLDVPRLLPIPGRPGAVVTIEEVLRANVDLLHPNVHVDGAYLVRVTRGGDLSLDEEGSESLLNAVADATERRPFNAAVRVEVERSTPTFVSELVLESLRRDAARQGGEDVLDEVQVIDGLLDLTCLAHLPLPDRVELEYPALQAREPVRAAENMFDVIAAGDLLAHHPFDSFEATVIRFIRDASVDPAVTTIKMTLYRVGDPSPIVAALLHAAQAGKRVVTFVELKARFDEEHNVSWARALEKAGGRVVYGLVGLKTHAKVALVVRREGERLRQYVHVGTGNYNARSGEQYTDLSLFSAREALTSDVADLFNELTSSSQPPQGLSHGALVAPHQLLPAVLGLIDREAANAQAGRPASIRIKVNGLSDTDVVRALYRAADAGVRIDLVVRGICTLRPVTAGLSAHIRVLSVVGRFLEHSRIYRFENDGAPEYLIGSSDLRPRNLRRRVEVLVPVLDRVQRARLDRILDLYLRDPTGWDLATDGRYTQRDCAGLGAQTALARGADVAPERLTASAGATS